MHRDIATDRVVATLGTEEDTDLRGQVGARLAGRPRRGASMRATRLISIFSPIVALAASTSFLDGLAVRERARQQVLRVRGLGGHGLVEDLLCELAETLALGDEVGLAEDLHEVPTPSPASAMTRPLRPCGPSRLVTPRGPLTRRMGLAGSPSASSRAFLTSIMPAAVFSRSA